MLASMRLAHSVMRLRKKGKRRRVCALSGFSIEGKKREGGGREGGGGHAYGRTRAAATVAEGKGKEQVPPRSSQQPR